MGEQVFSTRFTNETPIPMAFWSKAHWSMLIYMNSVMTDSRCGFQVGYDPRMTHNRRNHRVMNTHCPSPVRASGSRVLGPVMETRYSTAIIEDGLTVLVADHDDWCVVGDFASAGLLTDPDFDVDEYVHFSPLGMTLSMLLTWHLQNGGTLHTFKPQAPQIAMLTLVVAKVVAPEPTEKEPADAA